ncbi:glutaredoxin-like protein NrdH [Sinomonas atrocyanea]|jgi:glutaredoxin-like protein NrdH|uniref:glutaredoxin family protein n=1 Tax=Sinomonas atrocyanea TaxID=37927 RepID=UPI0027899E02|nr:glutaredoxin family protein [Sinomonas atrocyanea]MDP9886025.1 glutaredoxin-like protein NrdH [Sinomonas atrocyanea]
MENTAPAITLYSKPACVQCTMTKKALDKAGLAYQEVDLTQNPAALEYVTEELGYSMAPVVVVDDHSHWAGFQPQKISDAAAAVGATA